MFDENSVDLSGTLFDCEMPEDEVEDGQEDGDANLQEIEEERVRGKPISFAGKAIRQLHRVGGDHIDPSMGGGGGASTWWLDYQAD